MCVRACFALALASLSVASSAQIAVPPLGGAVNRVGSVAGRVLDPVESVVPTVSMLARDRLNRLDALVARNPDTIERDSGRQPARRGELLVIDPSPVDLDRAQAAGFAIMEQGTIDGLDLGFARLAVPPGKTLARGERALRRLLPKARITADQLHFGAGAAVGSAIPAAPRQGARRGAVGVIDGGVRAGPLVAAQAGFATGAPTANGHAQAIFSLLAGANAARVYVADVYGSDPAGGNALAIARALGWMVRQGVPVVSISLVGPRNPLVEKAIGAAQAKGVAIVAAVGNDGAAAPPAYPASYPGVIAVTGVDRNGRALFEAGRAAHLDYAAPGADMTAIGLDGRRIALRGTSFAAPLVAARLAALNTAKADVRALIAAADREAVRGGPRTGRGVLCGTCRTGI